MNSERRLLKQELQFNNSTYKSRYIGIIRKLYRNLFNKRFSNSSINSCQKKLIKEILKIEKKITIYKKHIKRNNQVQNIIIQKKNKSISKVNKLRIKIYQNINEKIRTRIEVLNYLRISLRHVGDTIAWIVYDRNREIIRNLGNKQAVGFIYGKKGFLNETSVFSKITELDEDYCVLLHDLTNCLKTADISIKLPDGIIFWYEIKSGQIIDPNNKNGKQSKFTNRTASQLERLHEIDEFLKNKKTKKVIPNHTLISHTSKSPECHHIDILDTLIDKARKYGFSISSPEEGLLYLVTCDNKKIETGLLLAKKEFPDFFSSLITFRDFNRFHLDNPDWLIPIPAMGFSYENSMDLIFNKINIMVFVNYDKIFKKCKEYGVELSLKDSGRNQKVIFGKGKKLEFIVATGFWERIFLEAMTIETFCIFVADIENIAISSD